MAIGRETLTSRERVVRTLNREPVDRIPIDLGSHVSTGISMFAYHNLRRKLGFSTEDIWLPDLVQCLAYVDEDVMRRFHIDCILLEPRWPIMKTWDACGNYRFKVPIEFCPQRTPDGGWMVRRNTRNMRMPEDSHFFDGDWLQDWGTGSEVQRIEAYANLAERIYKETEYATNFIGYSLGLSFGAFFGGIERQIRMVLEPDTICEENKSICETYLDRAGKIIDAMGGYVQLLSICDDMGTQNGPMCRPSLIEKCVVPFLSRFCDFVHRNSDIKVFMHNCGSIRPLIPMLIECGVDVLNPVQISAADMDAQELKESFGDQIVFWGGGCDTQRVLCASSPAEVRNHVYQQIAIFKKGGGYVFNQVHNIMANVPPENVIAMLDAAFEASWSDTEDSDT